VIWIVTPAIWLSSKSCAGALLFSDMETVAVEASASSATGFDTAGESDLRRFFLLEGGFTVDILFQKSLSHLRVYLRGAAIWIGANGFYDCSSIVTQSLRCIGLTCTIYILKSYIFEDCAFPSLYVPSAVSACRRAVFLLSSSSCFFLRMRLVVEYAVEWQS
jgi:hypothetical protein